MRTDAAKARYTSGIVAGIATNLIWALAFLVPVLLAEQSALALTIGRYAAYGLVSIGVAIALRGYGVRGLGAREWGTALLFAASGNVVYYFLAVMAILYAGAPVAAGIIGGLPVTVALYGNWRRREFAFRRLLWPVVLLLADMHPVNRCTHQASAIDRMHVATHPVNRCTHQASARSASRALSRRSGSGRGMPSPTRTSSRRDRGFTLAPGPPASGWRRSC